MIAIGTLGVSMAGLIIFDPDNPNVGFATGDDIAVGSHLDVKQDTLYYTDAVSIYRWEGEATRKTATWKSAQIRLRNPVNVGAAIVEADDYGLVTGGLMMAVGSPGTTGIQRNPATGEWTTFTITTSASALYDLAYGPTIGAQGRIVAVGAGGYGSYSDDQGATWTDLTLPAAVTWGSIAWSPTLELFVAGNAAGDIYSSTDGVTWTSRFTAEGNAYTEIKWEPVSALFVAVAADSSVGIINTSPDGITWTRNTDPDLSGINNPDTPECLGITELGVVIAPSSNPSITPKHAYSSDPDGAWANSPTNAHPMYDVEWSPTLLMWLGTTTNSNGNFVTSSDGTGASAFTAVANGNSTGGPWRSLRWSEALGIFVFIGSGTGNILMTSTNGTTFSNETVPSGADSSTWLRMREFDIGVASSGVTFNLYADGVLKHTQTVIDGEPFRLPGGYLSNLYEVEIVTTVPISRVSVAESIFELSEG